MNALPFSIAVHGGAGTITRRELTPALEAQYRAGITAALAAGHAILDGGGSSVDAVEAAVRVLEDDPLFNAGKGAVFTHAGTVELDAAIMDGATGRAGAVAGVTTLRNPVTAARAVMERSRHVLLIGAGAEAFAQLHGIAQVDPGYFHTERRWQQLQRAIAADRVELDHDGSARAAANASADPDERKFGTVGAVAAPREALAAAERQERECECELAHVRAKVRGVGSGTLAPGGARPGPRRGNLMASQGRRNGEPRTSQRSRPAPKSPEVTPGRPRRNAVSISSTTNTISRASRR